MTESRQDLIGWLVSVVLHLLLLLLFMLAVTRLKPFELEYTSIAFAPSSAAEAINAGAVRQFVGEKPLVELPRQRTIDDTSPLLNLPESERQAIEAPSPTGKPDLAVDDRTASERRVDVTASAQNVRERPGFSDMPLTDEQLIGSSPDALSKTIAGDEMFGISWEGLPRTRISGNLPEFPKDVNKAITVKIAFDVTPDGAVSFASPVTKGVPELERVALDALKSWRFNPLDRSQAQVKQRGVVTFIFQLK
jgi:TonB family protein